MFKSVREQSRNSESSILVVGTTGEPKNFEDVSTLFRSIDEAIREEIIEVYAPVVYADQREKRSREADYQTEIKKILAAIGAAPQEEERR